MGSISPSPDSSKTVTQGGFHTLQGGCHFSYGFRGLGCSKKAACEGSSSNNRFLLESTGRCEM